MSALDETEILKSACPACGGDVERWYFSGDCRGNPSSAGFDCKGSCGRAWSPAEFAAAREKTRSGK